LAPFLYKGKYFKEENEVRVIIQLHNEGNGAINGNNIKDGIIVPVDLNVIIDKIYLHPESTEEYYNEIDNIIKKHHLTKDLVHSYINKPPDYM
jgi:hypothetical protein